MKDCPTEGTFPFGWRKVLLGLDDDGNEVTSCVVVPCDPAAAADFDTAPRLRKNLRHVLDTLQVLLAQAGGRPVTKEQLIEAAVGALSKPTDKEDKRSFVCRRALKDLSARGLVRCVGNTLTLP